MQFKASIVKQSSLPEAIKEQMLTLLQAYYDHVRKEVFYKDLSQKDWVILLNNTEEGVVGFSTVQLISLEVNKKEHLYVFSGDTIIKEEARNPHGLTAAFIHLMYALINKHAEKPLYWFLISKGYRTYRFLPLYFKEYYPAFNHSTPKENALIIDTIAKHKFGELYNPVNNVITYPFEKDKLKPDHATISEVRQSKNPHIRFFAERNPTFYKGDDLASIALISHSNFLPAIQRIKEATASEIDASMLF